MTGMLLLGVAGGGTTSPPTKPDLTAWKYFYRMNEGSGTTVANDGTSATDMSTGAIGSGSVSWATDAAMGGTVLDFETDNVSNGGRVYNLSCPGDLDATIVFSLACVIRPETMSVGATDYLSIVDWSYYGGSGDRNGFALRLDYATSGIQWYISDGASVSISLYCTHAAVAAAVGHFSAGNVYSVICTYRYDAAVSGNRIMAIYVNGILCASTGTVPTKLDTDTAANIDPAIGAGGSTTAASADYCYDGKIAWVAFDTQYLDAAAVLSLHNSLHLA